MRSSCGYTEDSRRRESLGIAAELLKPVKQSELLDAILSAVAPFAEKNDVQSSIALANERQVESDLSAAIPPLTVLLVEDGLANQKLATGLLERWGHQVTIANNGQVAVELWEASPFDLILMDLQMPVMDGIRATEVIREREQERGGHIPIIAMTAHALKGDRERCLAAGMDGYASKPVRKQELSDAIRPFFSNVD